MNKEDIEKYFFPKRINKYNFNYFIPRVEIADFITTNLARLNGKVLDLACGNMPYEKTIIEQNNVSAYIPMDIDVSTLYNYSKVTKWDGKKIPLEDNSVDTVLITEFLEHVVNPQDILAEIYRVSKKGATVIGTVPFLWPIHESPHDQYRYTPYSLSHFFQLAEFQNISIKSLGGINKYFALTIALWMESKESIFLKILRPILLVIIGSLIKSDKIIDPFIEGSLFTRLGFTLEK